MQLMESDDINFSIFNIKSYQNEKDIYIYIGK